MHPQQSNSDRYHYMLPYQPAQRMQMKILIPIHIHSTAENTTNIYLICTTVFCNQTLTQSIEIDKNLLVRTSPTNNSLEEASVTMGKARVASAIPGVPNDLIVLKDSQTQRCISSNTFVLIPLKTSCKYK